MPEDRLNEEKFAHLGRRGISWSACIVSMVMMESGLVTGV